MATKIQTLMEKVLHDGARAAKFTVMINLPEVPGNPPVTNRWLELVCKGTSFPGKTIEPKQFMYKGRTIPIPGQEKYTQTWDLTFYLEEDHRSRLYFMDWMQALNTPNESYYVSSSSGQTTQSRALGTNKGDFSKLVKTMEVSQLDFDMKNTTAKYTLSNCYPISVGDVQVSSDSVGQVLEYTVTFSFSHFIVQSEKKPFTLVGV